MRLDILITMIFLLRIQSELRSQTVSDHSKSQMGLRNHKFAARELKLGFELTSSVELQDNVVVDPLEKTPQEDVVTHGVECLHGSIVR